MILHLNHIIKLKQLWIFSNVWNKLSSLLWDPHGFNENMQLIEIRMSGDSPNQ
jgi:hypothetical protein